jgi:hypothetical protein
VLAPSFFFAGLLPTSDGTASASADVMSRGAGAGALVTEELASSSSSIPKESFPLPATLRFFLKSGLGVDALYFAN